MENETTIVQTDKNELVIGSGPPDPEAVLEQFARQSQAIVKFVKQCHCPQEGRRLFTVIRGNEYPHYEVWSTLGHMRGLRARVIETRRFPQDRSLRWQAFEADAQVVHIATGQIVSQATASVHMTEDMWGERDEHAVQSMAGTRACGKAFRLVLSPIMVAAGYAPTPAEEMPPETGNGAPRQSVEETDPYRGATEGEQANAQGDTYSEAPHRNFPAQCKCGADSKWIPHPKPPVAGRGFGVCAERCGLVWNPRNGWAPRRRKSSR